MFLGLSMGLIRETCGLARYFVFQQSTINSSAWNSQRKHLLFKEQLSNWMILVYNQAAKEIAVSVVYFCQNMSITHRV